MAVVFVILLTPKCFLDPPAPQLMPLLLFKQKLAAQDAISTH